MPSNNRLDLRRKVKNPKVGQHPATQATPTAPQIIVRKNVQDALIEGLEYPARWAEYFLDVSPYEAQQTYLQESRDCTEANFVAGNRVGKTWISGVKLLWKAFYRHISPWTAPEYITPDNVYKAVCTSMTIDQAKLAWNYAQTFATRSPRFKPFYRESIYSPHPTMYLQTKDERGDWVPTEVWARSLSKGGMYLLGHSINYMLVDECAYVPNYPTIENEVIRMRLADTGGSIDRVSTPNGRNFFYDYYLAGLPGADGTRDAKYFSIRVTTKDNPWVSKAFLEEAEKQMTPEFYAQNVMAEFVSQSDFFRFADIQALYDDHPEDYVLNVEYQAGHRYVMGADLGAMRDPTVIFVLDVTQHPARMVYAKVIKNQSWRASRDAVRAAYYKYVPERSFLDSTGVGAPVVQTLIEEDGLKNVTPFVFTSSSKPDLLAKLQDAVQRKAFVFPFDLTTRELIHQMSFYRLDDKTITQDMVMAIALAWGAAFEVYRGFQINTVIDETMIVVPVGAGDVRNPWISGDEYDDLGPGQHYEFDPYSGDFVPSNSIGGGSRWGF